MKITNYNLQITIFSLLFLIFSPPVAFAQSLSLSISPPILEVMIMPGKEVTQTFTITNAGTDGYAVFSLVKFLPQGEYGQISTGEADNSGWFSLPEKTFIRSGETKNITVKISPPPTAPEKDYYFTLFYELENENLPKFQDTSGNSAKAKIGANILISVSYDGIPAKKAGPVLLTAPKIIDSLQGLTYTLRVTNAGQFLFKPQGIITVTSLLGQREILKLAPANVISGSTRIIPCLEEENLTECKLEKKVLLGIYKAEASFTADEGGPIKYTSQTTTFAIPFSITFGITTIILGYLTIKKLIKKTAV